MTEQFNNYEREFSWDDTIQQDREFLILEPGEYWFTVTNFERSRHEPSPQNTNPNKLPSCPKAIIELQVIDNEGKKKKLKHNLFLHSKTEGMISAFFGAIGQKKHGEPLKMNWNTVVGSIGVCSVKKSLSSNGNEYNETGYMIYSDDVDTSKQLNQRPGGQPMQQQPPQQGGWQPGQF